MVKDLEIKDEKSKKINLTKNIIIKFTNQNMLEPSCVTRDFNGQWSDAICKAIIYK